MLQKNRFFSSPHKPTQLLLRGTSLTARRAASEETRGKCIKDLRIRKNYSLPQQTISDIEELAKTLNCSASEAIVEAIKVVNSLLVVEEEPKAPKKRTTKKAIKQETKEETK